MTRLREEQQKARRSERKARGQFFTPERLAQAMVGFCRTLNAGQLPQGPIVDPACGDGVFLKALRQAGADGSSLVGFDTDGRLRETWRESLLPLVGASLHVRDGLSGDDWTGQAALAIGNPPFGFLIDGVAAEVAFARRFFELVRPGGLVAVILPEGLLANQRTAGLRRDLAAQARIIAAIGLSADVFRGEQAAARTAVVLARRQDGGHGDEAVLTASQAYPHAPANFDDYLAQTGEALQRMTYGRALPVGPCCLCAADEWGAERWDSGYWHPDWQAPLAGVRHPVASLGDYIEHITYGPIVTSKNAEPDALDVAEGIPVIGQKQFTATGLDMRSATRVRRGSVYDVPRARVKAGDLLLPRSGAGSLGRNRMAVYRRREAATVSCFVDLIRLHGMSADYVAGVLRARPGRLQLQRMANGVGTINISFGQIRSLRIPLPDAAIQRRVAELSAAFEHGRLRLRELEVEVEAALGGSAP